ncbi:MAG: hypothetical protein ACUVQG_13890, partial [Thermogutta sp.]
ERWASRRRDGPWPIFLILSRRLRSPILESLQGRCLPRGERTVGEDAAIMLGLSPVGRTNMEVDDVPFSREGARAADLRFGKGKCAISKEGSDD